MQENKTAYEIYVAERDYFSTLIKGNGKLDAQIAYQLFLVAEKEIATWESNKKAALLCYLMEDSLVNFKTVQKNCLVKNRIEDLHLCFLTT